MIDKERIKFIKYCISNSSDKRFRNNVKGIMSDWNLVRIENLGGIKSTPVVYHIMPEASFSGFFADHNKLLTYLYYADTFGFIPLVEYSKDYEYAENNPINGISNPFEYYFQQPSNIQLSDIKNYRFVLQSRKENAAFVATQLNNRANYELNEGYLHEMGRISHKYIKLRPELRKEFDVDIQRMKENKPTLGVHYRGTDFKRNYKGHPVAIGTEDYINAVKKLVDTREYTRIFLASDDIDAVKAFKKAFGNKLYYYNDTFRSSGSETVMKSDSTRHLHHYMLGKEVLRDAYTLAACDGLVAGRSQVSFGARVIKDETGKYNDLVIMDKGINFKGEICN